MTIISNSLVPELSISNFKKSIYFYVDIIGFEVAYKRLEEGFAFLFLGSAQLMIDEIGKTRTWKTAKFELPLGRGINFQIEVDSIEPILKRLKENNIDLFLDVEEKWYQKNNIEVGNKQGSCPDKLIKC